MSEPPLPTIDLDQIADPGARRAIQGRLNLVEDLVAENRALREENRRLTGEHGQPVIKPNARPAPPPDHSSARARHQPTPRQPHRTVAEIVIHRTEDLVVDRVLLPPDAQFKGDEEVTVQDIIFHPDNVRFRKETGYPSAPGTTDLAPLPPGSTGQFGPGLAALVLVRSFASHVSEAKILELLRSSGAPQSDGGLSNLLIKDQAARHAAQAAIVAAGLRSGPWQHLDDTATRVNGRNEYCPVLCNPLSTASTTTPSTDRQTVLQDRQTVLAVLRNGRPPPYRLNDEALGYLAQVKIAAVTRRRRLPRPRDTVLDEPTLVRLLDEPLPGLGVPTRKGVRDALAVAAYHAQAQGPVVRLLVCDDAPQFTGLTEDLALCWVHEGRHYTKVDPFLLHHRTAVADFLTDFWAVYDELLAYRPPPPPPAGARLEGAFDRLCSQTTGYGRLDERLASTRGKKAHLLLVLAHPAIPLHNNPADLGARARVRKRDVSFGPRPAEGARAWDTGMTLVETAKKLGVRSYQYLHDRVSGAKQWPALADLIDERAMDLHLGASWSAS